MSAQELRELSMPQLLDLMQQLNLNIQDIKDKAAGLTRLMQNVIEVDEDDDDLTAE